MKKAFTLIELLIVVAIIAILAAIAVPNFLEAQTRSKVSRCKADMRSLATAIEAYAVDWSKAAPQSLSASTCANCAGTPFGYIVDPEGGTGTGTLTYAITTPIAYMTTFMLFDPFVANQKAVPIDERLFTYQAYQWKWTCPNPAANPLPTPVPDTNQEPYNQRLTGTQWKELYGTWMMLGVGPDRNFYNRIPAGSVPFPISLPYDPTNGTVSLGNIIRSQKQPEQKTYIPM